MRLPIIALFIFSLTCFNACSQQPKKTDKNENKPAYELVGPLDFQRKMKSEPGILIDVRTANEQRKGMIPQAIQMDIFADNFETDLDKMDKTKTYYVYCGVGGRSAEAAELMQKKGFSHVVDLDGGFNRWKNEGLPVEVK